ncbi:MAG: YlxR family protein [Chloroflexi bacterium]|nr:YlxR family protein [Chloroflexota bacterium]
MARGHIPQRTCIACRRVRPKREMVRVVRTPAGSVEVDPTGKKSGRGAYLCRAQACWTAALQRQVLARALKAEVPPPDREALERFATTLPAAEAGEPAPDGVGPGVSVHE